MTKNKVSLVSLQPNDKKQHRMWHSINKLVTFAANQLAIERMINKGAQLHYSLSENLENSFVMGDRFESCSPVGCVSCSSRLSARALIYINGCGPNFILHYMVIPEPSDRECLRAHTLCAYV